MRAFGLLSPTKTDNAEAVALGEVLNGKYIVEAVEKREDGRPQYKCVTLHGHEEVLVYYVGRKKNARHTSPAVPPDSKLESTEETGGSESSYLERFEVQTGRDAIVYVVQAQPLNAFVASSSADQPHDEHEQPDRDSYVERPISEYPEERPTPPRSRIRIYKRGVANLEVDIPSYGIGLDEVCTAVCYIPHIGLLFLWTGFFLAFTILTFSPWLLLLVFLSLPFWILPFFCMRAAMRSSFTHENITITPTNFRIKRRIEFWSRHRDSVNNAVRAEAPLNCIDRISCVQVEGATSDLTMATLRWELHKDGDPFLSFVLLEGQKEHKLYYPLSNLEKARLFLEVNTTLYRIKGSLPFLPTTDSRAGMDTEQSV